MQVICFPSGMIVLLPWILIFSLLAVCGFFMLQQYRDVQRTMKETELRLEESRLRCTDLEQSVAELTEAVQILIQTPPAIAAGPQTLPSIPETSSVQHPSNSNGFWKVEPTRPEELEELLSIAVEEAGDIDDAISKLEEHVGRA